MLAANRLKYVIGAMAALTVVGLIISLYRAPMGGLQAEEMSEDASNVVKIGVLSPKDEELPKYEFLAGMAEEDINSHLNASGTTMRFQFMVDCAQSMAQEAQDATRRLHEEGVNLSVGYAWSSQLCASYNGYGEENGVERLLLRGRRK